MPTTMEQTYNTKNVIEDFLKDEYQEGLRNEFNTMEALINKLSKDTISGKKKYKTFALGVTDNIRAVGNKYDNYQLGFNSFYSRGVDTVDAEFDTTKVMATFAITDEAILKGTGDGTFLDVFKDQLDRMEIGQRHTMQRYTYGTHDGKIGKVTYVADVSSNYSTSPATSTKPNDEIEFYKTSWNNYFPSGTRVFKLQFENSYSILPGMGIMISDGTKHWNGYIWQKDNSVIGQDEYILFVCQTYYATSGSSALTGDSIATITLGSDELPTNVYSRQLDESTTTVQDEYHGLGEILEDQETYATIFGLNRKLYPQLKSPMKDLQSGYFLSEELMRDMADHLALSNPDGTAINLTVGKHKVISQIEKNLYQLKDYNNYVSGNNQQMGGEKTIRFDNYELMKDKFARGNHVYFLDTTKIGELVRRDWTWITSGEVNGVLQRRDGTELYEGIMNKYADMYVDAFKAHAIIKNCKVVSDYADTFGQTYAKKVEVVNTVTTKDEA